MKVKDIFGISTFMCLLVLHTEGMVVKTNYGILQGRKNEAPNGKMVVEFLGVPYAKPPLGDLRFKASLSPESWQGTREATKMPNTCIQKNLPFSKFIKAIKPYRKKTKIDEDCLYLNIWIPDTDNSTVGSTKLPVMIYFYGGGYFVGSISGDGYDGGVLATEENVIVVTAAYRVGVMGFLSLDDKEVTGNAGLFDQQLAMKWVKENIEFFGGDKENIVLYGQSSGASSISYHLVTPSSWDYFQRAILQSGFPNDNWSFRTKKQNDEFGRQLLEFMNCEKDNITETLKCLGNFTGEEISKNEPIIGYSLGTFLPVVDGTFLKEHPSELLKKGQFKKCDILAGVVDREGTLLLSPFLPEDVPLFSKDPKPNYPAISKLLGDHRTIKIPSQLVKMAEYAYTDLKNPGNTTVVLETLERIVSDFFFTCSCKAFLRPYLNISQESKTKVFNYLLTHKMSYIEAAPWIGVSHGMDVSIIFGHALNTKRNKFHEMEIPDEEKVFTKRVLRYWANFARTGNPNVSPTGEKETIEWPEQTLANEEYLLLAPNVTTIGTHRRQKICTFINEVLPDLVKDVYSESCKQQ